MNVGEGSLVTEHFTVDCPHHELLHLPLKEDVNTSITGQVLMSIFKSSGFLYKTKLQSIENHTMEVLGEDTCSLIAASSR